MAKKRRSRSTPGKRRGNRVIIYIRVSDTTGREDTLISDKVQMNESTRLVRQEGLEVVDTIIEFDKTGRESSKRAIAQIIDRVEAGEVDGVVVWKISRWGRNTIDSMLNIGELHEAGGFILSATENLNDIETPAGVFSLTVLLAIAQMYSDEIGKTWANIHDYRRKNGKTHNGTPRFGYINLQHIPESERSHYNVIDGCDYVVDPIKGPWLRKAYEMYISGIGLNTVARHLDHAGIRSTRDRRITYKSLLATMDGGFAAGLIVDRRGDSVVFEPGTQEPLITPEMWAKYQRRRNEKVAPRLKSAPYRMAGLLKCGGCGSAMVVGWRKYPNGEKRRYFRCSRIFKQRSTKDCPAPSNLDEARAERIVLEWLKENATGQGALEAAVARAQAVGRAEADVAKIDREIARTERRMSILYDDKVSGEVSPQVYRLKEAELVAELERLRASRDVNEVTVEVNALPPQTAFGALLEGWERLPPEVVNRGIKAVVRTVVVSRSHIRGGNSKVEIVPAWEPPLRAVSSAG